MKSKLALLLLFVFASCQNSSTISGKVYDQNKEVLEQAKVQVIGTDIYTFTDDKGYFEIEHMDRGDELLIVKPGYQMVFHDFKTGKKDLKFYLELE